MAGTCRDSFGTALDHRGDRLSLDVYMDLCRGYRLWCIGHAADESCLCDLGILYESRYLQ